MPEFHEQLATVARLRETCRADAEAVYRARLELHHARQEQTRADQQHTLADRERARAAAGPRAAIARLNSQLAVLHAEVQQRDAWLASLAEARRLDEHLRRRLDALRRAVEALDRVLAELREQAPRPDAAIADAAAQRSRLAAALALVEDGARRHEASLEQLTRDEARTRDERAALERQVDDLRRRQQAEHARLAEVLRPSVRDPEAAAGRVRELEAVIEGRLADGRTCADRLRDAIDGMYGAEAHPRAPLRALDDRTPFLLLPVRLETIFVPAREPGRRPELWVRVYPDEIAIDRFDDVLTGGEAAAGELYWTSRLWAEYLRAEREPRRRASWRHLVDLLGGPRATWVARQTKPPGFETAASAGPTTTLPDLLLSLDPGFFDTLMARATAPAVRAALQRALDENDGDELSRLAEQQQWLDRIDAAVRPLLGAFPTPEVTKADGWTRAPRTSVMPDRFVLLLYANESASPREVTGLPIPDTLFVGPDPLDAGTSFPEADGAIAFGPAFDWMSDFDKAVSVGMGFRVPLSDVEFEEGFARVAVLGVRVSADAVAGATALEQLIDQHQFGPAGFALVPQGTPTNNSEGQGSGFSDRVENDDRAYTAAGDPPAFDPASTDPRRSHADGRVLADALGIEYAPLLAVPYADATDVLEARAMNTALFPGTLGYWLRQWMAPIVTEGTARHARAFFTRQVSGRGPLPAVRVGNQPYGVLVTSDAGQWSYDDRTDGLLDVVGRREYRAFLTRLHGLIGQLERVWDDKARGLPFVGKPGTDAGDVLMHVLGLHPTSVEFYQRVGFSHEYLRNLLSFTGRGRYAAELNAHVTELPDRARLFLRSLGVVTDRPTVAGAKSLKVLWQHYTNVLDVPNLVEGRPPSEVDPLQANYIRWLATAASTQQIVSEQFPGPRPSALLYLMLRNALLLQLHSGSYQWLQDRTIFEPALEQATAAGTLVAMRAATAVVSKLDLMATSVEHAEPTHPVPGTTVADWIWAGPTPAEAEAAFLREQKSALEVLADAPTARLERCLIEHLDCCNYRLDAWRTGLFAERLEGQRQAAGDRARGIYLGAYGWVEELRPSAKTFLDPATLPESLRPADGRPVLEEDEVPGPPLAEGARRGGFVHAPSLSHAAAAALLRSAYLSHAAPERADMFAVNLSSERVRRGQFVLDGMRNGQPLEALLGYQFERGLHDRTSRSVERGDVPVVELNRFIQPYRQAFVFESKELPPAGGGPPVDTVPAYSVVNGLKLAQASLSAANGFGLSPVLSSGLPGAAQGAAILAEQAALLDTLDAVKDLLTAESAFQLVRGNYDRVGAVSLAQKEAHVPPELEVVRTPRGTDFTFTNRVTLHFPSLDPLLPATNPWPGVPMTPRARAEAGLNHWIGTVMGVLPEQVVCTAGVITRPDDPLSSSTSPLLVTLAELELQPVDVVWLAAAAKDGRGGATELESRIAFHYRRVTGADDEATVKIGFGDGAAAGQTSLEALIVLARHVHGLLAQSRPLHAGDLLPAAGGQASSVPVPEDNPKGYDPAQLRARVERAAAELTALADALEAAAPLLEMAVVRDPAAPTVEQTLTGPLGDAFDLLDEAGLTFTETSRVRATIGLPDVEAVHATLRALALFGLADAFPPEADLTADASRRSVLARAHRLARRLRSTSGATGVLQQGAALLATIGSETTVERQVARLLDAARIVIGDGFTWLPAFQTHNAGDLATSAADRAQLLSLALSQDATLTADDVVDEWLQGVARVRGPLHRWETVRSLAEVLGARALTFSPVQVPYRARDHWLAVEFPADEPGSSPPRRFEVSRDTLSIVAHGAAAFEPAAHSGLLLDEWTEEIPTESEITGVAFRFNRPNAVPPQTLLLAVTPVESGSWQWDHLVGTLSDTLRRMKQRAVEPAQLETQGQAWNAFAPALVSEFSTDRQSDVSLDFLLAADVADLHAFHLAQAIRTP